MNYQRQSDDGYLIYLSPGVGVNNQIVILNRVVLSKIFIVIILTRPDGGLRVRGRRGKVQSLLVVNNGRVAVNAVHAYFAHL